MKSKILSIILLLMIAFSLFTPISVYAADTNCPLCGQMHDMSELDGIQKFAYDMNCTVFGGQMFLTSSISDDVTAEDFETDAILRFNVSDENSIFYTLWQSTENIYKVIATIGTLLVVVYVLIEMMDRAINDLQNPEFFVKGLIKLVVGIMIINNGYDIIEWVLDVGSAVFTYAATEYGTALDKVSGINVCSYQDISHMNFFESLLEVATLFLPWLILSVSQLVATVVAWIRIFDIVLKGMFAPIGMADMVTGGLNSQGFKYLKKLGASCMQGAVILVITQAYGIVANAIRDYSFSWLTMVMLAILSITLILKSSNLSNEIMGVS